MKIAKVIRLEEKYTQYDISTAFENFYAKTNTAKKLAVPVNDTFILIIFFKLLLF